MLRRVTFKLLGQDWSAELGNNFVSGSSAFVKNRSKNGIN